MEIRAATSSDSGPLAELRWEFRLKSGKSSEKSNFIEKCTSWFEHALSSEWWSAIVVENNGVVFGCMCLQSIEKVPSPEQHIRHWGYLINAYVSPTYRNKGASGSLLKAIVDLAQKRKLELLIVWPSIEAFSLYESCGFRIAHEMHQDPDDFPPMELVF